MKNIQFFSYDIVCGPAWLPAPRTNRCMVRKLLKTGGGGTEKFLLLVFVLPPFHEDDNVYGSKAFGGIRGRGALPRQ